MKRSKSLFANHIGSFSYDDLRDFLLAVLSGRRKMAQYHKFPKWQTKDCRLIRMKCAGGVCEDKKRFAINITILMVIHILSDFTEPFPFGL